MRHPEVPVRILTHKEQLGQVSRQSALLSHLSCHVVILLILWNYYYYYYCIDTNDRRIYLSLFKSTQSAAGLKAF